MVRDLLQGLNTAPSIASSYKEDAEIVLYPGDCSEFLSSIPNGSIQLIVTSPPYNIGKEYEKKMKLEKYIEQQSKIIKECVRVLSPQGSICWQVGNYVDEGSIVPLDTVLYPVFTNEGLKMRNRIIWHFEHGLHCKKRFSGRYETIVWFTKTNDYKFYLDPVRIPQKYPGKRHFKGPKIGQLSCNPLGKNPGDIWNIPNVKSNHIEKTAHPCQFPVELIERLVLSLTDTGDRVLDPFLGTGTSIVASIRHKRKGLGAEIQPKYIDIAESRILSETNGLLKTRPMGKEIYDPEKNGNSLRLNLWSQGDNGQGGSK